MTLIIKHDDFPEDIMWTLRKRSDGSIVDSRHVGFYNKPKELVVHHIDVIEGIEYKFTINDVFGDGFRGYFKMFFGTGNIFGSKPSDLIASVNGFVGYEHDVKFIARLPDSAEEDIDGDAFPSPTPAPTSCKETISYETKVIAFTNTPRFTTPSLEFGVSETLCARHSNYADCTNEVGEDCQWIFLTQGERMGKCRVDPISKCLQTGDCVCSTQDFHGGDADGILFHVPISITARDISPNSNQVTYTELYQFPTVQNEKHPQDDSFFISKVDFTGRQIQYVFNETNPTVTASDKSVFFKLHFLYMDVPMVGTIWDGLGLNVTIDTSATTDVININGRSYNLPKKLKMWTCSQIVITSDALYVAGVAIPRDTIQELNPPTNGSSVTLGSFTGELFDVRVYSGNATIGQVYEVGARCAGPNDPATIKKKEDIETEFLRFSCSEINPLAYGIVPPGGIQTYGSSAFATLWLEPIEDPLHPGEYLDVPEGDFDEEYFFQQAKLQSYQWERQYFENDMIGFVLEPYRMFTVDELPEWSAKTFNNPCRYIHQNNNVWEYPLYNEGVVSKWNVEDYMKDFGGRSDSVFDLGTLYAHGGYYGYAFFTHEAFHEFHARLVDTYNAQPSGWLQESGAESAPALLFPGEHLILASVALAPSWPLSFQETDYNPSRALVAKNPHIFTGTLSLADRIRGGHYYGTWVLWWFLSQHAGLPHLLGQMFSVDRRIEGYWHGKLQVLRLLLRSNDIDLGDAWIIFVAHFRTWDFKNGATWKGVETDDFEWLKYDGVFPSSTSLEGRKTTATISATAGTNGNFVAGPAAFKPTPFSWNCLTARSVADKKVIGITLRWDAGMGFAPNVNMPEIVEQHAGCDDDVRFFNSMAVLHNEATGERRYWKMKGKNPSTLYISTGNSGPVTLHVLLMPTPSVDYSAARNLVYDAMVMPLPIYSYKYKIEVLNAVPTNASLSPPAEKEFGVVKFDSSSAQEWFSVRCSCLDNPENPDTGWICLDPVFQGADSSPLTRTPTLPPTPQPTLAPTPSPTLTPTLPPTNAPTLPPTMAPTTAQPTMKPTPQPTTAKPTPIPTTQPTRTPTLSPTLAPTTAKPTRSPTPQPTTAQPTPKPTVAPTKAPTLAPTLSPTTAKPTRNPTPLPTTAQPTPQPSRSPTLAPTRPPTSSPTTAKPTGNPTPKPTTAKPTPKPSRSPTLAPTRPPTSAPTTAKPTGKPTPKPTTAKPTMKPTTTKPTMMPTTAKPSTRRPTFRFQRFDSTIKPSTQAPSADTPDLCFSGAMVAIVENQGPVRMKDLQLGDRVLVATSNTSYYEPIYSFGHRLNSVFAEYLVVLPSELEISKDHMVFVEGGAAVPAGNLVVGDRLENGEMITAIKTVQRLGIYAPFTPSGAIVVNGVRASSFVAFQASPYLKLGSLVTPFTYQWLAHTFEAPHRIWCMHLGSGGGGGGRSINRQCLTERYADTGISSWVQAPLIFSRWLLERHSVAMAILLVPLIMMASIVLALESVFFVIPPLYVVQGFLLLFVAWCAHWRRRNQRYQVCKFRP